MKIVNVVATVKLSSPLDFNKIIKELDDIKSPKSGSWLKYRLKPEGYYIAFYKSGKFLITGVKSIDAIKGISERVIKLLYEAGINVKCEELRVDNIVITDEINLNITLEKLVYSLDYNKYSYEPEQFPALIYRDWGASYLLFPSGKIIVTGINNTEEAIKVIENFKSMIYNYK